MNYLAFRFQLALIVIGLGITAWGGHMTIVGMGNMSPTQMTYADYCKQNTSADWLILDDCFINWSHTVSIEIYDQKSGKTMRTEYYAPIYPAEGDSMRVKAFLAVEDKSKISLIQEAWAADDRKFEANQNRYIEQKVQIKGLARTGLDLDSDDQRLLKGAADDVDPNFRIIEKGKEPQGFLGFVVLLAGLGMLGGGGFWFVVSVKGGKRKQLPYPPGPGGPRRPGMPGRPAGPARPGLPGRPGSGRHPGVVAPPPPAAPMHGLVQQAPPYAGGPGVQPPPPRQVAPPPPYPGNVQAPPQRPQRPPAGPQRPPAGPQRGPSPGGPSIPRPRRRRPM